MLSGLSLTMLVCPPTSWPARLVAFRPYGFYSSSPSRLATPQLRTIEQRNSIEAVDANVGNTNPSLQDLAASNFQRCKTCGSENTPLDWESPSWPFFLRLSLGLRKMSKQSVW